MKHDFREWAVLPATALAAALLAQQPQRPAARKPVQSQSVSTVSFRVQDTQEIIEITNVAYELTGNGIPGRPRDERLVLRKTSRTKDIVDEIAREASTSIQAWPLGVDLKRLSTR
jgi:hypothetical protein